MNQPLKRPFRLAALAVGALLTFGASGCSDADQVDSGGVMMVISDFGTLPIVHSLTAPDEDNGLLMQIDSITVRNVPSNASSGSSELMTIRVEGYEVTYRRRDSGSRVPRSFLGTIFGQIPANGLTDFNNLPMLTLDQLSANPFSDLSADGVDSETGSSVIVLDVGLRFFGQTLGGTAVASNVEFFTVQFVQ